MTKQQQIRLNFDLSNELATYLILNPHILKKYTGCSYVIFSYKNQELNKMNDSLISEILNEGRNVVKAQQTGNTTKSWILKLLTSS